MPMALLFKVHDAYNNPQHVSKGQVGTGPVDFQDVCEFLGCLRISRMSANSKDVGDSVDL